MEQPGIQTSFIPRQPLVRPAGASSHPGISLVSLISTILFIISLLGYGGVYLYSQHLANRINAKCPSSDPHSLSGCGLNASLDRVEQDIDETLLLRLKRVDAKLTLAKTLLANHITPATLLAALGQGTVQSIRYKKFDYKDDGQNGGVLTVEGTASSYGDIAQQSTILAGSKLVKGFIFSDLNLDDKGNVVFKLSATLLPDVTRYTNSLNLPQ